MLPRRRSHPLSARDCRAHRRPHPASCSRPPRRSLKAVSCAAPHSFLHLAVAVFPAHLCGVALCPPIVVLPLSTIRVSTLARSLSLHLHSASPFLPLSLCAGWPESQAKLARNTRAAFTHSRTCLPKTYCPTCHPQIHVTACHSHHSDQRVTTLPSFVLTRWSTSTNIYTSTRRPSCLKASRWTVSSREVLIRSLSR